MSSFIFKMPDLGEGTVEAELAHWHITVGDWVTEDQVLAEVMTDKAAMEISSPVTGFVLALYGSAGDVVPVGADLVEFGTDSQERVEHSSVPQDQRGAASATIVESAKSIEGNADSTHGPKSTLPGANFDTNARRRAATSPAVRRRAKERGVDLSKVKGTGRGGRITVSDFENYCDKQTEQTQHLQSGLTFEPEYSRPVCSGTEEIRIVGVRRIIAQRMSEAKRTIPHFSYIEEVDISELESLRSHINGERRNGMPVLTYLPFIVLALVRALSRFPHCNARHDAVRDVLVLHAAVHVGIATQTDRGLMVPVLRHAEGRDLTSIARSIKRLSDNTRQGTLAKEEMSGSTITITSLGKLGGIATTPIINAPEVAIIGINRAIDRPVVTDGGIAIRRLMNVSASFDHRFIDGTDAANLIQELKNKLETPALMFLQMPPSGH